MDWISFGLLLSENLGLFLLLLAGSVLLYIVLFRRFFISVLDPAMIALLFSVFGFAVVWFLFFTGTIDPFFLYSYLATQIAFWLGLFTFRSLRKEEMIRNFQRTGIEYQEVFETVFFVSTAVIYILLQLTSYKVIGVPLLLGNHINLYYGGGGWGILGRILDVVKPCSVFMLIYFLLKSRTSLFLGFFKYSFTAIVLLFFALSGSKGEFLSIGYVLFCFLILNAWAQPSWFKRINRIGVVLIAVGAGFAFLTIVLSPGSIGEGQSATGVFLYRLVASGDIYYFAYPNGNITRLDHTNSFLALFGDIFSTLRLVPREKQPVILGVQLFRLFSNLDITAGPNARHNVFGYLYYGFYGSIIFSYLLGFTLSLVRNKLFFQLRKSLLGQLSFVMLYLNLSGIETDPPMAVSNLENVMLIFPVLLLISLSIYTVLLKDQLNKPICT
jgi:hypothetical protein